MINLKIIIEDLGNLKGSFKDLKNLKWSYFNIYILTENQKESPVSISILLYKSNK